MIVLPSRVEFPIWVTQGFNTLGVRVPKHDISQRLARLCGGSITSTSANKSGMTPPCSAVEAENQLGEKVDLILDAGLTQLKQPSTVVQIQGKNFLILREGPIKKKNVLNILKKN
jgi:L-threonylcarbamoyladenylate synthase